MDDLKSIPGRDRYFPLHYTTTTNVLRMTLNQQHPMQGVMKDSPQEIKRTKHEAEFYSIEI